MEWLIALWLTALGGFIGSFLNVVVYRLPAGMSIVASPLALPGVQASHPLVRQRARAQLVRVARPLPRLPGGDLAALSAGRGRRRRDVPPAGLRRAFRRRRQPAAAPVDRRAMAQLWGIYAYHLVLLCTLLAAALMQYDGHRPPRRLFLPALVVGLAAPAVLAPAASRGRLAHRGGTAGRDFDGAGRPGGRGASWAGWPAVAAATRGCAWAPPARGCSSVGRRPAGWSRRPRPFPGCFGRRRAAGPAARRLPPTAWLTLGTLGWILAWGLLVRWFRWCKVVGVDGTSKSDKRASRATIAPASCCDCPEPCNPLCPNPRRSAEKLAVHPRVAQLSGGVHGHRVSDESAVAGGADGAGVAQAGVDLSGPGHRLDDRGFRQHADRRGGGGAAAAGAGPGPAGAVARRRAACARSVAQAERLLAKSHYYETAREFSRLVSESSGGEGQYDFVDYDGRGAGDHGGRQPRRLRSWAQVDRTEHPPAAGAAAQRLHHPQPLLPVPLFRHPQVSLRVAGDGVGGVSRRIRHRWTSCSRC